MVTEVSERTRPEDGCLPLQLSEGATYLVKLGKGQDTLEVVEGFLGLAECQASGAALEEVELQRGERDQAVSVSTVS
jgi:hypothetical protein